MKFPHGAGLKDLKMTDEKKPPQGAVGKDAEIAAYQEAVDSRLQTREDARWTLFGNHLKVQQTCPNCRQGGVGEVGKPATAAALVGFASGPCSSGGAASVNATVNSQVKTSPGRFLEICTVMFHKIFIGRHFPKFSGRITEFLVKCSIRNLQIAHVLAEQDNLVLSKQDALPQNCGTLNVAQRCSKASKCGK